MRRHIVMITFHDIPIRIQGSADLVECHGWNSHVREKRSHTRFSSLWDSNLACHQALPISPACLYQGCLLSQEYLSNLDGLHPDRECCRFAFHAPLPGLVFSHDKSIVNSPLFALKCHLTAQNILQSQYFQLLFRKTDGSRELSNNANLVSWLEELSKHASFERSRKNGDSKGNRILSCYRQTNIISCAGFEMNSTNWYAAISNHLVWNMMSSKVG